MNNTARAYSLRHERSGSEISNVTDYNRGRYSLTRAGSERENAGGTISPHPGLRYARPQQITPWSTLPPGSVREPMRT